MLNTTGSRFGTAGGFAASGFPLILFENQAIPSAALSPFQMTNQQTNHWEVQKHEEDESENEGFGTV